MTHFVVRSKQTTPDHLPFSQQNNFHAVCLLSGHMTVGYGCSLQSINILKSSAILKEWAFDEQCGFADNLSNSVGEKIPKKDKLKGLEMGRNHKSLEVKQLGILRRTLIVMRPTRRNAYCKFSLPRPSCGVPESGRAKRQACRDADRFQVSKYIHITLVPSQECRQKANKCTRILQISAYLFKSFSSIFNLIAK